MSYSQNRNFTIFSIKDNGRGIAEADMHQVFKIFRRASNVSTVKGDGMGMAYIRPAIKRHGGKIWCESVVEKGSVFYFSIARNLSDDFGALL